MTDPIKQMLIEQRRERLKALGLSVKQIDKKLLEPLPEPRSIELNYKSQLLRIQSQVEQDINNSLTRQAGSLSGGNVSAAESVFNGLSDSIMAYIAVHVPGVVSEHGYKTRAFNFKKYDNPVYNVLGLNGLTESQAQDMLNSWAAENVKLITRTNAAQLSDIEVAVLRFYRTGSRAKELEQELDKIYRGTRNNISVIARDQIGKLNGQLDRAKQLEAGVEGYYWRTSLDERVRSLHVSREGKYYSWDKPPADGAPGQPIQCRCQAQPALSKLLGLGETAEEARAKATKKRKEVMAARRQAAGLKN